MHLLTYEMARVYESLVLITSSVLSLVAGCRDRYTFRVDAHRDFLREKKMGGGELTVEEILFNVFCLTGQSVIPQTPIRLIMRPFRLQLQQEYTIQPQSGILQLRALHTVNFSEQNLLDNHDR